MNLMILTIGVRGIVFRFFEVFLIPSPRDLNIISLQTQINRFAQVSAQTNIKNAVSQKYPKTGGCYIFKKLLYVPKIQKVKTVF